MAQPSRANHHLCRDKLSWRGYACNAHSSSSTPARTHCSDPLSGGSSGSSPPPASTPATSRSIGASRTELLLFLCKHCHSRTWCHFSSPSASLGKVSELLCELLASAEMRKQRPASFRECLRTAASCSKLCRPGSASLSSSLVLLQHCRSVTQHSCITTNKASFITLTLASFICTSANSHRAFIVSSRPGRR